MRDQHQAWGRVYGHRSCAHLCVSASLIWALFNLILIERASAHGEVVLCDATEDLIEQCGEIHDCVTDPEVSEVIGYCRAETEDISFTICDRRAEVSRCEQGEVCKIGTLDPNIGACAEVIEEPTDDGDDHDHGDHDHGDHGDHGQGDHGDHAHGDHDHSCQASPRADTLLLFGGLLLGMLITRWRSTWRVSAASR